MSGGTGARIETADRADTAATVLDGVLGREPTCGPTRVLALDGGAAAGKTELAFSVAALAEARGVGCAVVHTDDLLDGWEGQFTFWPRLRTELLEPICQRRTGRYARYDWNAGRFAGTAAVAATPLLIIEGVSSIAACGPFLSFGVFLDVPRPVRERRWSRRDGAPLEPRWEHWLDREDGYFAAHPVHADAVLRWPDPVVLPASRAPGPHMVDWSA